MQTTMNTLNMETLQEQVTAVEPQDTMAEAGRKILLRDFIKMLSYEAGSRTGEDIEDVHQMRVATRRMRSAFRLLNGYYKDKSISPFMDQLKKLASRLGDVRDLDVMINDLQTYQSRLDDAQQAQMQEIIDKLDKRRKKARGKLNKHLDSSNYQDFAQSFAKFLTTTGKGTRSLGDDGAVVPHQVRHVLPTLVYEHLAQVRAYDTVIDGNNKVETLHALRIEFKRLRYLLAYFEEVLGSSIKQFISELKAVQDYLGRLNDAMVAKDHLKELIKEHVTPDAADVLEPYVDELEAEIPAKVEGFPEVWEHFNTRTVQSQLANALLVLR